METLLDIIDKVLFNPDGFYVALVSYKFASFESDLSDRSR